MNATRSIGFRWFARNLSEVLPTTCAKCVTVAMSITSSCRARQSTRILRIPRMIYSLVQPMPAEFLNLLLMSADLVRLLLQIVQGAG